VADVVRRIELDKLVAHGERRRTPVSVQAKRKTSVDVAAKRAKSSLTR
jgi:hypothetical protein